MCIYGYVRISRPTQDPQRQVRNILNYESKAKIFSEAYTGTTTNRPEWLRLLSKLQEGDTIVFDSVSRMSRNSEEGVDEYFKLFDMGINLVFLKEPHIDTSVYRESISAQLDLVGDDVADCFIQATNQVLMILAKKQIVLAFEQSAKEVADLQQRTKEGLQTAKLNGKQVGRVAGSTVETQKSVAAKDIILKHSKDFGGTLNDSEVIQLCNISRNSYYKYIKELRA